MCLHYGLPACQYMSVQRMYTLCQYHIGNIIVGLSIFRINKFDNRRYKHTQSAKMRLMQQLGLFLLLFLPPLASGACDVLPDLSVCRCEYHNNRNIINCKSKGLTVVPQFNDVAQVYDELTLAKNNIANLDDLDFQFLKVKLLDISDNPVVNIAAGAFTDLNDNLEELILHVDGVTDSGFPTEALSKLPDLQSLQLQGFDMNQLPNGAISQLTNLRELHLQSCGLQQLTSNDLQGQRNTLEVLDLNLNAFQNIPTNAIASLQSLRELVLTANQLSTLQTEAFQGVADLRELDLSQNSFQTVQSNAFTGLEDLLQTLRMQHCGLQQQQLMPMEDLRELVTLDLAHNSIGGIPSEFFTAMSKLNVVNFASNNIGSLSMGTFNGLEYSLTDLNLEYNNIGSIQDNSFAGLTLLQTLALGFQSQSLSGQLNVNTFKGLEDTLELLGLASVGFSDQNWPSVNDLWNLRTLDLRLNKIQSVPDWTFLKLEMLETLRMTSNHLGTLTQRGMHGLEQSLQVLKLDANDIEVIDHCVLAQFDQLDSLDLHDNPLQCDCQLRWLREWTVSLSPADQDGIQWECASPPEHAGKRFMDLDVADFQCNGGDSELPECEDLTPTTTTTSSASSSTPSLAPQPILVAVENTTDSVIHISWSVIGAHDITGFSIQYFNIEFEDDVTYHETDAQARNYYIEDLEHTTSYYICVAVIDSNPDTEHQYSCVEAKTEPKLRPVTEDTSSTAIIVAAILGAVFVVGVILVVVFIVRWRCRKQHEDDEGGFAVRQGVPQVGYNSKRFSKPKPDSMHMQNYNNTNLEKKLEGFTEEERDRIINLFTNSGASTLSMISTADSERYVPEPPPPRPRGTEGSYENPVDLHDENFYFEIPEEENYDQIPADNVQKLGQATGSVYI